VKNHFAQHPRQGDNFMMNNGYGNGLSGGGWLFMGVMLVVVV
jgi:hypothetical protein